MNTSCKDYDIDPNDIEYLRVLKRYASVTIHEALWRHELICIKEIRKSKDNDQHENEIRNELTILAKSIHPKVVQFLGAHQDEEKTTILFEYMSNGNLEEYLSSHTLSDIEKKQIMFDIVLGIHYLHKRKPNTIIHRDIKPSNILVNKHGCVKICDFGISKIVDDESFSSNTTHSGEKGTYMWMSPEVLAHEKYDWSSDIYSLGLILFYIWTQRKPFSDQHMNTVQIMYAKFQNKLVINSTGNKRVDYIVKMCIMHNPKDRPTTEYILKYLTEINQAN
jgi:serine/threonine protein kinase